MNLKTVHEPEEELLNGQDAWQDFLTLKTIEEGEKKKLIVLDRATQELVDDLVRRGICHSENEVIARAVKAFFVAVLPSIEVELR